MKQNRTLSDRKGTSSAEQNNHTFPNLTLTSIDTDFLKTYSASHSTASTNSHGSVQSLSSRTSHEVNSNNKRNRKEADTHRHSSGGTNRKGVQYGPPQNRTQDLVADDAASVECASAPSVPLPVLKSVDIFYHDSKLKTAVRHSSVAHAYTMLPIVLLFVFYYELVDTRFITCSATFLQFTSYILTHLRFAPYVSVYDCASINDKRFDNFVILLFSLIVMYQIYHRTYTYCRCLYHGHSSTVISLRSVFISDETATSCFSGHDEHTVSLVKSVGYNAVRTAKIDLSLYSKMQERFLGVKPQVSTYGCILHHFHNYEDSAILRNTVDYAINVAQFDCIRASLVGDSSYVQL